MGALTGPVVVCSVRFLRRSVSRLLIREVDCLVRARRFEPGQMAVARQRDGTACAPSTSPVKSRG